MGLAGVLFNPNGRIGPNSFWRGIIVLIGIGIVLSLLSAYVNPFISILGFLLIYPMICVFGKRLHDNGKTAWLAILFIIATFVVSYGLSLILNPMFGIDAAALQERASEAGASGDVSAALAVAQEAAQAQMIPSIISSILTYGIVGFFAARLSSMPEDNHYGPPEGGSVASNDEDDFL